MCFSQALGILVQLEGMKFGRRVGSVLPLVAACLHKGVRSMEQQQEETGVGEGDGPELKGWQEVYACLLLLERLATGLPTQVCCILELCCARHQWGVAAKVQSRVCLICCAAPCKPSQFLVFLASADVCR